MSKNGTRTTQASRGRWMSNLGIHLFDGLSIIRKINDLQTKTKTLYPFNDEV